MRIKTVLILTLLSWNSFLPLTAQYTLEGKLVDKINNNPINYGSVYFNGSEYSVDAEGNFKIGNVSASTQELILFSLEYETLKKLIACNSDTSMVFQLERLHQELSEVVIRAKREEHFGLKRLKAVEGTSIFAGKKNEVVLMDQLVGNMAANNARQIYGQVVGLNIYESNDAGLQLSIGGRGLDPNRTANFNTRQNGYDISADVLGYPESYYTPPAEALREIQVIRGAASLQYGTQFGGLINFKMNEANKYKKFELVSRQTLGSFGLFTSFNSLSGTLGKFSYYTYFNYKVGNGYRPNSNFNSNNFYVNLSFQFSENTKVSFENTYLNYLAKQAGGLTDPQFVKNPRYSNRERNWFGVDWKLYSLKFEHKLGKQSDFSFNVYGLDAERNALGFRGSAASLNSNPITAFDEKTGQGTYLLPRDLIVGEFNNWGIESRILKRYRLGGLESTFLIGTKLYKANNLSRQGAGSRLADADFTFRDDEFPNYSNQSSFIFPNLNWSIFGEHIFNVTDKFSITPGLRFEYINTKSIGTYQKVNFDNAGNPISDQEFADNRDLRRTFPLFGIGIAYKKNSSLELYGNFSQNYRSVTFSDIRTVSPTFNIDPNISDEKGYTTDFGIRGKWEKHLSYDVGGFGLLYGNRIGIILDDRANRVRKNIGKAFIYGLESFVDWNIANTLFPDSYQTRFNWFVNMAITSSEYLDSEENNVIGKKVEFIPLFNFKTGLKAGFKNMFVSTQLSYLSEQFTDVQNSQVPDDGDNRNGVIGTTPSYLVIDFSASYTYKNLVFETGINNVLNSSYFTRRATGYPGPGIIPSDGRSGYFTFGVKI